MITLDYILREYSHSRSDGGSLFDINKLNDLEHFECFLKENGYFQFFHEEKFKKLFENRKLYSVDEGNFPERQAYNKDGLLVTFPTPEYKQRAIKRGTHFEENPKKADVNIFADDPNNQSDAKPTKEPEKDSAPVDPPPSSNPQNEPTSTPVPNNQQTVTPDVKSQNTTQEPEVPVDSRTSEEKKQDALVVQKMLTT
jgi:hypothetical protein